MAEDSEAEKTEPASEQRLRKAREEGDSAESAMRILRHEAGHAIDTAYRLRRRKRWREVFGPASLLVACRDVEEMRRVTDHLEGQLTATLQLEEDDYDAAATLLPALERKVGRILANGFPTGVEVSTAMVHGGPFPATADGRSTSVGTGAILRFLRPVCYQNLPQALLPEALRDGNPQGIWRRTDGVLGKA